MEKDAPFSRRSRLTPDSACSEITKQSTQSNLQESQGRLAAIVEKSPDFIGIAGLDMTVLLLGKHGGACSSSPSCASHEKKFNSVKILTVNIAFPHREL